MSRLSPRPTLKTVAAHMGLSVSTISRALKDSPDIGKETIALVKQTAARLGYIPDTRGITLRTGRTYTLLYLKSLPTQDDVPDGAVAAQIDAITTCLRSTGYQLQLTAWNPSEDALDLLAKVVEGRLADGIILDSTKPFDVRVRYLLEKNIPFITFGRTELLTEHAYVDADNEQAAYDATAHLLTKGHHRIALMGASLEFTFALQRRRGYQAALRQAGLPVDPGLVRSDGGGARVNYQATQALLQAENPPTGFVCANETATLGVMAALRDQGRQIGAGVDVVGRESSALFNYLSPPPCSCRLDSAAVAAKLVSHLLARIDGAAAETVQTILPCQFIDRTNMNGAAIN